MSNTDLARITSTKVLTQKMRQGAALEAAGIPEHQIAESLEVNKKTVKGWGENTLYLAELDRLQRVVEEKLEPKLLESQHSIIEAGNDAIKELHRIALHAANKDGTPANTVRMQASIALSGHLMKLLAMSKGIGGGGGDDGSTQNNFVQNNMSIKIAPDGTIDANFIDADAIEDD